MAFMRFEKREAVTQDGPGALEGARSEVWARGNWLESDYAVPACFAQVVLMTERPRVAMTMIGKTLRILRS